MNKKANILIVSMARCGSSAILELIKNSCEKESNTFFEPTEEIIRSQILTCCNGKSRTIVKVILRPYLKYEKNVRGFFPRTIGLTRDPRDNLISRLFFRLISDPFKINQQIYEKIIPVLEKKIENPNSISVVQIFRIMEESGLMEKMIDKRVEENLSLFMDWHNRNLSAFIFSYEKFVLGDFTDLSDYLELAIEHIRDLKVDRPEIKRAGKFGEWKNWFTSEDVAFFKPRMEKFMRKYCYPLDWQLPDDQKIDPVTSIDYIKRYACIA